MRKPVKISLKTGHFYDTIENEVNFMEENKQSEQPQEETHYEPRPAWQLWGARIGLVLFILFVIWQVVQIYRGFR